MSLCAMIQNCYTPDKVLVFLTLINLIWLMILTLAFARKK